MALEDRSAAPCGGRVDTAPGIHQTCALPVGHAGAHSALLPKEPRTPRPWTAEQVIELPAFGAENGWFYGLVVERYSEGKVDVERLVLAEIIPGEGYSYVAADELDDETWATVVGDLTQLGSDNL